MKNILFILLGIFIMGSVNAQDYKVIVNSTNTTSSISKSELSAFLLKKKTKWSTGEKVAPVDQSSKSAVRINFTSDIHGKSVGAIKSYWQQYVFAGKGTPPSEKKSDAEIVNFVKGNAGAIGYVSAGTNVSGVKVLSVN